MLENTNLNTKMSLHVIVCERKRHHSIEIEHGIEQRRQLFPLEIMHAQFCNPTTMVKNFIMVQTSPLNWLNYLHLCLQKLEF
jgi:hypothetical protein